MTHQEATSLLNSAKSRDAGKPISNNTRIFDRGNHLAIRLHNTDILRIYQDGKYVIDVDGWQTVTTKQRLNEYLPRGVSIYQERSIWYVNIGGYIADGSTFTYQDGLTLTPSEDTFTITYANGEKPPTKKAMTKLNRSITTYVNGYLKTLNACDLDQPGPGDCFYCQGDAGLIPETQFGTLSPDGTMTPGISSDHLLSHIEEKYYVPSLLVNAIREIPVSQVALWHIQNKMSPEQEPKRPEEDANWNSIATLQIKRTLTRYLRRKLGLVR